MSALTHAVYNRNQFTKTGKLKKNAVPELSRVFVDVEPLTLGAKEQFIMETATQLKKYYTDFRSPYIFTHIEARSIETGEPVHIFESVRVAGQDMMTSPTRLYGNITNDPAYSL